MNVTHVIFDFDGLLVDTEGCYTIANQTMLRKFGREYTPELNAKMMGRKEEEAFPWLLKEVGIDGKITVKEYMAQYDAMLEGMFLKCKALPGAERLVRHLSKKGVPMAICSGSRKSTFRTRREPHKDWLDLIGLMVFCGDEPDIKRGKPHPDPYLATMNRFPVKPKDPSNVLVFEDAPNGGRSAKAAGMKCVMVPSADHREEVLQIGVTKVLNSLTEFRPEEFGLPPFD
ncbi:hypothetical protein V3C99_011581 [Haemonchus contortus]